MMTMKEALQKASAQFAFYADQHRLKKTPEGDEKAIVNDEFADMCLDVANAQPFQVRAGAWGSECMGPETMSDETERFDRFIEEVFELAQARCYDFERIPKIMAYVAERPMGEPGQELGGVMLTVFTLANAIGLDVGAEAERELARVSEPETMAKIRAKQAAKPSMSPLPQ